MTHDDFTRLAVEYAKMSVANGEYPFGAVVVRNGEVIGDSRYEISKHAYSLNHAEIGAIIDACEHLGHDDLSDCILYSSCQPCGLCKGAIKWTGIKAIYYAMDKDDAKAIGYLEEIFMDDFAPLAEHKIADKDLPAYMKNWYDGNKE